MKYRSKCTVKINWPVVEYFEQSRNAIAILKFSEQVILAVGRNLRTVTTLKFEIIERFIF